MKMIMGLTLLWILGIGFVLMRFTPGELSGWDVLVRVFYITMTYLTALFGYGFLRAAFQFRDTLREEPQMEHPGHRRGLVREGQLPDWMRKDWQEPTRKSSVPQVPRPKNKV